MRTAIVVLLLLVAGVSPLPAQDEWPPSRPDAVFPPEFHEPPPHPHAALVDSVLASLDDRARAGQLIVVYRADNDVLLAEELGGVLLFSSMLADTWRLMSNSKDDSAMRSASRWRVKRTVEPVPRPRTMPSRSCPPRSRARTECGARVVAISRAGSRSRA